MNSIHGVLGFLQSSHVAPEPNTQHTSIHYSWSFGLLTSNTEMAQRRRNSIIWMIPRPDHRLSLRLTSTHPKCIDSLEKSCTLKTTFPLNKKKKRRTAGFPNVSFGHLKKPREEMHVYLLNPRWGESIVHRIPLLIGCERLSLCVDCFTLVTGAEVGGEGDFHLS